MKKKNILIGALAAVFLSGVAAASCMYLPDGLEAEYTGDIIHEGDSLLPENFRVKQKYILFREKNIDGFHIEENTAEKDMESVTISYNEQETSCPVSVVPVSTVRFSYPETLYEGEEIFPYKMDGKAVFEDKTEKEVKNIEFEKVRAEEDTVNFNILTEYGTFPYEENVIRVKEVMAEADEILPGDEVVLEDIRTTFIYEDGKEVKMGSGTVSIDAPKRYVSGNTEIQVSHQGIEYQASISVPEVEKITVKSKNAMPGKQIVKDDLEIKAFFNDGTSSEIDPSSVQIEIPDRYLPAETDVSVSCYGDTYTCKIDVPDIVEVKIKPSGDILPGDEINSDELQVSFLCSNGEELSYSYPEIRIESPDCYQQGETEIKVLFCDKEYTVSIPVPEIEKISLHEKTEAAAGDKINTDDLSFVVSYNNGKTMELASDDVEFNNIEDTYAEGENKISFQYLGEEWEVEAQAIKYPVIQDETFPMSYLNRDGSIDITVTREEYFGAVCYVSHIFLSNGQTLSTIYPGGEWGNHAQASEVDKDLHSILLVNGDFRDRDYGANLGIIRDGKIINDITLADGIGLTEEGDFCRIAGMQPSEAINAGVVQTWTFGPWLVENGEIVTDDDSVKHPRTFIGQVKREDDVKEYYIIVADGRQPGYSIGLTNLEMAKIMKEKKCHLAYNIDGGGSSTILFNGKLLNSPSDGEERRDGDFLFIKHKKMLTGIKN